MKDRGNVVSYRKDRKNNEHTLTLLRYLETRKLTTMRSSSKPLRVNKIWHVRHNFEVLKIARVADLTDSSLRHEVHLIKINRKADNEAHVTIVSCQSDCHALAVMRLNT